MTQNQTATEQASASSAGAQSQWDNALANLRNTLQGAGVPPETTDSLTIRYEDGGMWLTDVRNWGRVMLVSSPGALEDAQYGLAWMYRQARPARVNPWIVPYADRASQRPSAAR